MKRSFSIVGLNFECVQCSSAQTKAGLERNLLLAGFVNTEVVQAVDGVEIAKACTTSSVALNLVAVRHHPTSFVFYIRVLCLRQ